jgi:hypothetical protein
MGNGFGTCPRVPRIRRVLPVFYVSEELRIGVDPFLHHLVGVGEDEKDFEICSGLKTLLLLVLHQLGVLVGTHVTPTVRLRESPGEDDQDVLPLQVTEAEIPPLEDRKGEVGHGGAHRHRPEVRALGESWDERQ